MAVTSTANKVIYMGSGSTGPFPFTFIGVAAADIQVVYTDTNGNQSTLPTNAYTLTLNAPGPGQLWGIGGSVTLNTSIAIGTLLTITRQVPLTQPTSFQNQGALYPAAVEQGLDLLMMALQQVSELQGRAIQVPISDANPPPPLPAQANRILQNVITDASGNVTVGLPAVGTANVSVAMQAVVAAATLALARTALGLGTASAENLLNPSIMDDGAGNLRTNNALSTPALPLTIGASNYQQVLCVTGPGTITFNRANTYFNGFSTYIHALGGAVTLAINASDQFEVGGITSAVGASFTLPEGAFVEVMTDAASTGNWRISGLAVKYKQTVVFNTSGTYTPSANLAFAEVTAIGPGGAGGGTPATGANQQAAGGGGGSGAKSFSVLTPAQIGASQAVTVGAGGAGNSGANGSNGSSATSFGSLVVANAGNGGFVGVLSSGTTGNFISGGNAGAPGAGDLSYSGDNGRLGITLAAGTGANNAKGGDGGPGFQGAGAGLGASAVGAASAVGGAGYVVGAGGGGAVGGTSQPAQAGGAGFAGQLFVREWIYTV
jgi:hypothetical protein